MRKSFAATLSILLVTILVLTGCNKSEVNEGTENENKQVQSTHAIEFMYDSEGGSIRNISDKVIDNTVVTKSEIEQIPLTYRDKTYTEKERELFAKQSKAMQPVLNFTDDFIKALYNINPNNIVQQAKRMASITIDQVKPEYDNIINQVNKKKINRRLVSYKIDQILSNDAKIIDNGEIVPGRIVSSVVSYVSNDKGILEDMLELHIVNLDGTWKIVSFKVK